MTQRTTILDCFVVVFPPALSIWPCMISAVIPAQHDIEKDDALDPAAQSTDSLILVLLIDPTAPFSAESAQFASIFRD